MLSILIIINNLVQSVTRRGNMFLIIKLFMAVSTLIDVKRSESVYNRTSNNFADNLKQ